MHSRPLALILASALLGSCAYQGVVVEKNARELPFSETVGVPGSFTFLLRDSSGAVHRQMVTPEVFTRYEVGDYFNDTQTAPAHRQAPIDDKMMLNASGELPARTHQIATTHKTSAHKALAAHSAKSKSRKSHSAVASHKHHAHKTKAIAKAKVHHIAPASETPAAAPAAPAAADIVDVGSSPNR